MACCVQNKSWRAVDLNIHHIVLKRSELSAIPLEKLRAIQGDFKTVYRDESYAIMSQSDVRPHVESSEWPEPRRTGGQRAAAIGRHAIGGEHPESAATAPRDPEATTPTFAHRRCPVGERRSRRPRPPNQFAQRRPGKSSMSGSVGRRCCAGRYKPCLGRPSRRRSSGFAPLAWTTLLPIRRSCGTTTGRNFTSSLRRRISRAWPLSGPRACRRYRIRRVHRRRHHDWPRFPAAVSHLDRDHQGRRRSRDLRLAAPPGSGRQADRALCRLRAL